jgi:N-hydroxyarylamine O-acetyltransferase
MSPTSALRLEETGPQPTPHETRRLLRENGLIYHQVQLGEEWHDICEFTLEEMPLIDREVANWYTSAHPGSHFKNRLLVARALPDGARVTLLNRELTVRQRDGQAERRILASPDELLAVLEEKFGLSFTARTRFQCEALDWPTARVPLATS